VDYTGILDINKGGHPLFIATSNSITVYGSHEPILKGEDYTHSSIEARYNGVGISFSGLQILQGLGKPILTNEKDNHVYNYSDF
jgi:hypothetical protein